MSFQLKPNVCSVDTKIRIPKREEVIPEVEEEEWEPNKDSDLESNSDSDEYEIVYVTDSDEESSEWKLFKSIETRSTLMT